MVYLNKSLGTFVSTSGNGMDLNEELSKHAKTGGNRYFHSVCLTGGSAALDTGVEIVLKRGNQTKTLARIYNTQTARNVTDDQMLPVSEPIPANSEIQIFSFDDAPAECFIHMIIRNRPRRRRRRR